MATVTEPCDWPKEASSRSKAVWCTVRCTVDCTQVHPSAAQQPSLRQHQDSRGGCGLASPRGLTEVLLSQSGSCDGALRLAEGGRQPQQGGAVHGRLHAAVPGRCSAAGHACQQQHSSGGCGVACSREPWPGACAGEQPLLLCRCAACCRGGLCNASSASARKHFPTVTVVIDEAIPVIRLILTKPQHAHANHQASCS